MILPWIVILIGIAIVIGISMVPDPIAQQYWDEWEERHGYKRNR